MSIDINWETLTGGEDGVALAETIRAFIHDRFQQVTLPRMIRSVKVHSFDLGTVPPTIEIRDVCDPLPDFYDGEEESDDEDDEGGATEQTSPAEQLDGQPNDYPDQPRRRPDRDLHHHGNQEPHLQPSHLDPRMMALRSGVGQNDHLGGNPLLQRTATPGLHGGTSNLGYFHLPLSGLSGTSTPLAAVAGAQFHNAASRGSRAGSPPRPHSDYSSHRRSMSFGSVTPSSVDTPHEDWTHAMDGHSSPPASPTHTAERDKSAEDVQIVSHITYSGDIKLSLTAEILLDYPMPSFVGIPLKLNITGLTFDGVAILAYMKKKAHFCFLCPEDADTLVGSEVDLAMAGDTATSNAAALGGPQHAAQQQQQQRRKIGGLLEEIKVESEIGEKETGKQVLKNVGKIEKFVLEQVRRIFEDEFVYPSFWTFLV